MGAPSGDNADLVADLYEAAVTSERWPDVLDALARRVSAAGTGLFLLRKDDVLRWVASEGVDALFRDWFEGGWQSRTERAPRMIAMHHPGFVSDLDIMTREELDRQPDQVGFLRPRGYGWGTGTFVEVPNGDVAIYSIERRQERGPFEREAIAVLDGLRPHLARSALLANRLGLERARSAVATLEAIGLAGAVLDRRGRTVAANRQLEALRDQVLVGAADRLRLVEPDANELLVRALCGPRIAGLGEACSIPLRAAGTSPAAVAHVVPLCGEARDIFARASAILVVTPVASSAAPEVAVLQGLFDLSPSEARVARGIVEGRTVHGIAASSSLSVHTVRTQLRMVMAKLGVTRQADVVSLLSGLSAPGARGKARSSGSASGTG